MTRTFIVASPTERLSWKLTAKKKKVLDYVCMGADLQIGKETITAWFTPKIPVSAGPYLYYGLPGMILGLEKNGEVFLLATDIDREATPEEDLMKLDKGQKLSPEKFEQVVEEKTKEYELAKKARDKDVKKK